MNEFPNLGESGSEVSHFILEPINFIEVTRLPTDVKKACLKATLKEIINLIKNKTFIMDDRDKVYPVKLCMCVYKENIQSGGILDKLKLIIVARGDLQNKEMIGYTWAPTSSMRTLNDFLADSAKYK